MCGFDLPEALVLDEEDSRESDSAAELSRNPIAGLDILTSTPSFRATVEQVNSPGDLQAAGLILGVIEDLAFEADRLASQFRQSVPSLASGAYDEYLKPPQSFNGNVRAVQVPNLGRILNDDRVQNLSSLLDVQNQPAPIDRAAHLDLRKQLDDLVTYLETESPEPERMMANVLAVELKRGPIALIDLGEQVDHCFFTSSVAARTTGSLTSHALRWSATGNRALAEKVFLLAVAVTGLFFAPAGAVGVAIAAHDIRKVLSESNETYLSQ